MKILEQNVRGRTSVEGNELNQDSLIDDAAAVRIGGPNGGKLSFDVKNPESSGRREIVLFTAGESDAYGAEFKIIILRKGGSTVDGDQVTVMEATAQGIEFRVPVKGLAFAGGLQPGMKIALRSLANGRLVCAENAQGRPLLANRDEVGPWETFEVITVP